MNIGLTNCSSNPKIINTKRMAQNYMALPKNPNSCHKGIS